MTIWILNFEKASGLTLQSIADKLNELGVKTVRGGAWHPSTVANILKRGLPNEETQEAMRDVRAGLNIEITTF